MAFDTGPIATENQFPCQTLVARLYSSSHSLRRPLRLQRGRLSCESAQAVARGHLCIGNSLLIMERAQQILGLHHGTCRSGEAGGHVITVKGHAQATDRRQAERQAGMQAFLGQETKG